MPSTGIAGWYDNSTFSFLKATVGGFPFIPYLLYHLFVDFLMMAFLISGKWKVVPHCTYAYISLTISDDEHFFQCACWLSVVHLWKWKWNRSIMSNSLRPGGLLPTRLLHPWGFSRQEYWSGMPFPSPGDLPNPGIEPRSPTLQADALTSEPPGIFSDMYLGLRPIFWLGCLVFCYWVVCAICIFYKLSPFWSQYLQIFSPSL